MLADLPIGEPVPYRQGSLGEDLDLHAALVPNPVCTFYMRVRGNRLRQHGIQDGDPLQPLLRQGKQWLLEPVRPGEAAIPLDLDVFGRSGLFGVVVHAVHHLNKPRLRKI